MTPSIERIREALYYDPESGVITWKIGRGGSIVPGRVAGCKTRDGYVHIKLDGMNIKGHRVAWALTHGRWPSQHLDHINGNPSDNRIENLRECNDLLNNQNRRKPQVNSTSGYLGVSYHTRSKGWRAQIKSNGRRVYLGVFSSPELASAAYLEAKRRLHPFNTI